MFLCAAKKMGARSCFQISADKDAFDKKNYHCMAKCKKNLTNLDYTVLAADDTCPKAFVKSKKELAAISFIQGPKEVPSQVCTQETTGCHVH